MALEKGEIFYIRHIEAGLVRYMGEDVLVSNDTLIRMNPSFAGCPIYVGHVNGEITDCEKDSVGYVQESFYNPVDGAHWAKVIITNEDGLRAVRSGYGASNAYKSIEDFVQEGTWHNMPYQREVVEGNYTSLALVDNPRYEFSKVLTPEEYKKYNSEKEATVRELRNSLEGEMTKKKRENMDKEIQKGGEEMSYEQLKSAYEQLKAKVDGHKKFEDAEDANLKQAEDINKKEEEFMENGCVKNAEVADKKHEDDMEALDRRIADSVKREFEARMSDKDFWRKHIASLEERKEDDEEAEKEYKKEERSNAIESKHAFRSPLLDARSNAEAQEGQKYTTKDDFIQAGYKAYSMKKS